MDVPTREIFWNVKPFVLLTYLMAAASMGSFAYGLHRKINLVKTGKPGIESNRWTERLRAAFLWERRFFRRKLLGMAHFLILWSMVVLLLGTAVIFLHEDFRLRIMTGSFYLVFQSLILDIVGLLAAVGVIIAAIHRYVLRPKRLNNGTLEDGLLLVLLFLLLFTGFALEGLRIAATDDPWAMWSPVGLGFGALSSLLFVDSEALQLAHKSVWLLHAVMAFATIGVIPYTKLRHVITGPANVLLRSLDGEGIPKPIDFEKESTLGVARISDATRKQLLDLETCTACGRCEERCPAFLSGKPLTPRQLILDLRARLRTAGGTGTDDELLVPRVVTEETIWSCTTCLACQVECPLHVEHVPKVIDLRRYQVMEVGEFPAKLQDVSNCVDKRGHPFPGAAVSRGAWTEGLESLESHLSAKGTSLLYWVGCSTALNERTEKIAVAFYRILQAAGIEFRILGAKEPCCGDPARRIGNEYQYESVVRRNLEMFSSEGITSIVTVCPHCYSAFKNDYAQFGGRLGVWHHTEILDDLVKSGRISPEELTTRKVTYHDPCYLGRYNGVYESPRSILRRFEYCELTNSRSASLCCGGGGGRFWIEEQPQHRVSYLRMQEILDCGAEAVVTACPFCMLMLDEAAKGKAKGQIEVIDLAELVLSSIRSSASVAEGVVPRRAK